MKLGSVVSAVLLTACSPAALPAAAPSCQLAIDGSFPVTYLDHHLPVITVRILGQDMRLLVDTGSMGSLISTDAYNRLHLNQTYNPQGYSTAGLGGNVDISAFALVDINLGAVRVKDEVVGILARPMAFERGANPIDGILGYDVLQYFDIGLDLPRHRITFYTPQHCVVGETPWQGDYAPMPFTRPQAGSPVIPETIDGKDFNVVIDTGAYESLIMQASLKRNGVTPEAALQRPEHVGAGIGDLQVHITQVRFGTLAIGAEIFSDARLDLDTTPQADINMFSDGLLGEDYFASHRVFIANSTNTVYLGLSGK